MGKGALKFGGKSGILPRVRPVFKRHPIRPLTPLEKEHFDALDQGYAEGVPVPTHRGQPVAERNPQPQRVVLVSERIEKTIESRRKMDSESQSSLQNDKWAHSRNEIRRDYLKQAYLNEAERLAQVDARKEERALMDRAALSEKIYVELEASRLTIPTLDSYLSGPIMRQRTQEEQAAVDELRTRNRLEAEYDVKQRKAQNLLELYHAAQNFITTESELERAIEEAFEVNFSKHDSARYTVEDRLSMSIKPGLAELSERLVTDHILGEINGRPGVEVVKDTLSGELQRLRQEAIMKLNDQA